ncbi:MAG: ABC transporter ATP-binding protein, partial [Peptococcaceae bacterium]|nr:ABC transporter ATP-binding protein [Peptococcaceae bacterium]
TKAGTMVSARMFVREANRVASTEYEEEIFAVNFFKTVDEIKESMALDTDIKTWANASAWSMEDDSPVEITEVVYDFDWENIEPGDYQVTFKTEGYQYMIDTTDKYEVGEEVGLTFGPQDIHIMKKGSY